MSSNILRCGNLVRPAFNHYDPKGSNPSVEAAALQIAESTRNAVESLEAVLERIESQFVMANRTLRRMDRRLAKRLPLK